ncbi:melanosome assembly [Desmophyllum pertusum]|uniref:Melanosome assembly n=1 Tax=Desmophyllum pertusum TaxID=174260 RepID=A0A9W9ZT43_9CNID|nr:melanosome assembly [Desmophyllum pertusum]
MTALIAPVRAASFEGLIFFVYDREAVKKEADPPENAIVYFYPPSASIEDRISVCGQLIGMSHFMHSFISARPALCKLTTEKVATIHSGKYTLALGGSLSEPDSLLIRQLETLHSIFTFYHGSLERIRMMCDNQKIFLTWMNVIWDCYLHFVRHYGDFLPGVFDPLPFLDLPKRVAATCFTKASYILQACQRRQHVLGGCILYSNSILCTQLEPSITERLLLLKPNQSNHPARPVKTENALPFGVRILNAFLSLSEYLNLYDALAESAYRQPALSESSGTFPDMYTTSSSSAGMTASSSKRIDASDDKNLSDTPPRVSSDISDDSREGSTGRESNSTTNSAEEVSSAKALDTAEGTEIRGDTQHRNGDSVIADQKESSGKQSRTESNAPLDEKRSSVEDSDEIKLEHDVDGVRTTEGGDEKIINEVEEQNGSEICELAKKRDEEEITDSNGDSTVDDVQVTNLTAAFDSSSCESALSNDVILTMDAIDVAGVKVVDCSSSQYQRQQCDEEKDKIVPSTSCTVASCNNSNCRTSKSTGNDDNTDICRLVVEDLVTQVAEIVEGENSQLNKESLKSVIGTGACCLACADAQKIT